MTPCAAPLIRSSPTVIGLTRGNKLAGVGRFAYSVSCPADVAVAQVDKHPQVRVDQVDQWRAAGSSGPSSGRSWVGIM